MTSAKDFDRIRELQAQLLKLEAENMRLQGEISALKRQRERIQTAHGLTEGA